MRNRTLFDIAVFVSLAFLFFALTGFAISVAVGKNIIYVPLGKDYYEKTEGNINNKKIVFFGEDKTSVSEHNIFDLEQRQIDLSVVVPGINTDGALVKESKNEPTDINYYLNNPDKCQALDGVKLTAIVPAIPVEYSSISVEQKATKDEIPPTVISVGEEVDKGTKLLYVDRNIVVFETPSGVRCLGDAITNRPKNKDVAVKAPINNAMPTQQDVNIRKIDDHSYVVSRSEIMKATTNLNVLARQARIVPARGEAGFKIFSIRPNSLYSQIGLQNGDVIKNINGIDISSPDKALEAYQRLRNADKISLNIVRGGKPESMEYTIE